MPRAVKLDFPRRAGLNCWYVAIANVLQYHGWADLSEPLAFGISSRLTLRIAFKENRYPVGNEKIMERMNNVFSSPYPREEINRGRLGVRVEQVKDRDWRGSWNVTKGELSAGRPQLVQVRYSDLPHVAPNLRADWGHVVTVIGFDEKEDVVHISDGEHQVNMPTSAFLASRNALVATAYRRVYLEYRWCRVHFDGLRPLENEEALRASAYHLFSSSKRVCGRTALIRGRTLRLADWLDEGIRQLTDQELKPAALRLHKQFTHSMAPHHTFRCYARFLDCASTRLGDPLLLSASAAFGRLADQWEITNNLVYKAALLASRSVLARVPSRIRQMAPTISEELTPLAYDPKAGKLFRLDCDRRVQA